MLLTPLDLLTWIASSKAATEEQRKRLLAILISLRDGLERMASEPQHSDAGKALFSNSASDFFCYFRVMIPDPPDAMKLLESEIEQVVWKLQQKDQESTDLKRLYANVQAVIASVGNIKDESTPT